MYIYIIISTYETAKQSAFCADLYKRFHIALPFNVGLNAENTMLKGLNVKRTLHERNRTQHLTMVKTGQQWPGQL